MLRYIVYPALGRRFVSSPVFYSQCHFILKVGKAILDALGRYLAPEFQPKASVFADMGLTSQLQPTAILTCPNPVVFSSVSMYVLMQGTSENAVGGSEENVAC